MKCQFCNHEQDVRSIKKAKGMIFVKAEYKWWRCGVCTRKNKFDVKVIE